MPTRRRSALPLLALALSLFATLAAAGEPKPARIVSTTPSVTGILLAMDAPLVASAATTPSRLTDAKGFFSQWAKVADQRGVEVLYRNLRFDIEAVIAQDPDLLVASATGADSAAPYRAGAGGAGCTDAGGRLLETQLAGTGYRAGPAHRPGTPGAGRHPALRRLHRRSRHGHRAAAGPGQRGRLQHRRQLFHRPPGQPQARLLEALGFRVAELPEALAGKVTRASDFQFISRENLPAAIAGDSVFLLGASDDDVQAFLADPVLANLSAVREKRVYALGPSSFRIDYYSGRQMIDNVARHFR